MPSPRQFMSLPRTPSTPTISSPSPNSTRPELAKAKSIGSLPKMTAAVAPSLRGHGPFEKDSDFLNTLPDPRTPSPMSRKSSTTSFQHPDLSNEVAMLSTKLVNAINHQTSLDDSLQQSRHDLEAARRRIVELEAEADDHANMLARGLLVKRTAVDASLNQMKAEVAESRKQRDMAEKAKKEMEVELETLTTSLFEEANEMVSQARKETEAVEKKNAQLRSQLSDMELLLASQQEQLHGLKSVMEKMSSEQDETETIPPRSSTAPSTPGGPDTPAHKMSRLLDTLPMSPSTPNFGEVPPDQPLRFSHLITPVMRSDVQAYAEFAELLKSARALVTATAHSRNSSGAVALNTTTNASNSSLPSTSSLAASPVIPGSFTAAFTSSSPRGDTANAAIIPPLKEYKFFKRCLVEDVEPTLRLDLAPGLSWLARRTVVNAISNGTLMIEPFVPPSYLYARTWACSLCGEARRDEKYARRHRFRTSEDEAAQKHPLCGYCLGRMRATCDYLGFLRMVRDGLWRAATDEDMSGAWEESVRLREKMFWSRLGGGVVPTTRPDTPSDKRSGGHGSLFRPLTRSSISSLRRPESVPESTAPAGALEDGVQQAQQLEEDGGIPSVEVTSAARDFAHSDDSSSPSPEGPATPTPEPRSEPRLEPMAEVGPEVEAEGEDDATNAHDPQAMDVDAPVPEHAAGADGSAEEASHAVADARSVTGSIPGAFD